MGWPNIPVSYMRTIRAQEAYKPWVPDGELLELLLLGQVHKQAVAGFSSTDAVYHHPVVPGKNLDIWIPGSVPFSSLRASVLKGIGFSTKRGTSRKSKHTDKRCGLGPVLGANYLWSATLMFVNRKWKLQGKGNGLYQRRVWTKDDQGD